MQTIDKIAGSEDALAAFKDLSKEQSEKYKMALNEVASTPNGAFVLRVLINALKAYEPMTGKTAEERLIASHKRDVYLIYIRKYLERDVRITLEN